jgi:hypothetical protein
MKLFLSLFVYQDQPQSMDHAWHKPKNAQDNVDPQMLVAPTCMNAATGERMMARIIFTTFIRMSFLDNYG